MVHHRTAGTSAVVPIAAQKTAHDSRTSRRAGTVRSTDHSRYRDIVQEWGEQSFPASDPPANW